MARKLRPALDLVSDIGSLGFDLQHHSEDEIRYAVAVLRTVNPEMFDWLVKVLGAVSTEVCAVDPQAEVHGKRDTRDTKDSSSEAMQHALGDA